MKKIIAGLLLIIACTITVCYKNENWTEIRVELEQKKPYSTLSLNGLKIEWSASMSGEGYLYTYLFEGVHDTSKIKEHDWSFKGYTPESDSLSIAVQDGDELTAHHKSGRKFLIQIVDQVANTERAAVHIRYQEIKSEPAAGGNG